MFYFQSIAEITKKEAALVLMFLIFWKNYKKEQKNHVEKDEISSCSAPYSGDSTEKPPKWQNNASTTSPIRCIKSNECQDWKEKKS